MLLSGGAPAAGGDCAPKKNTEPWNVSAPADPGPQFPAQTHLAAARRRSFWVGCWKGAQRNGGT
ncbi:hypothetical protein AHIS1636_33860 [Arthrobacter mangrovi]|uniref:Uncharacterized protein n=1 Tax=Arthrobacter mangrovi TaxID=2966350 RepID=A0ABQ5MYB4_9MICC|nr:hypothetical protein AHIS1636_33860 [Arthrobacter mangrovi]